ncbi:carbohydrate kinase family protein [Microbacterium immunditiarum]|uniref:Sugar/nucleoside kinase (Ribokinase family) n=1 Tax=Microbacterium immunditiarum TaxID=337480 RepID=A0A7Y9GPK9_9MICO|nr:PfkB family carbohydrate kinase [Microbacterium immunditiarum]NYE20353.1 sugar/nucleoside kinase (ribokinase family) [Microbacterium immunditiarum]
MLLTIGDLIDDVLVRRAGGLERGTDNVATIRHARGGSAANVAAAAAASVATRFIGCVGDDPAGDALVRRLEQAGVDVRVQRGGRTGTIVILVDDEGERTMITDRGAAAELGPIDPAWLDDVEWVHVPLYGFSTEPSRSAVVEAIDRMLRPPVRVSLDLSSVATMRELGTRELRALIARVRPDVVFANRDEAACAGALALDLSSVEAYIVKRGGEPVVVTVGGDEVHVAVEPVEGLIDSTGAGDAFAAGYIATAMSGADVASAARAGADLARRALTELGAL